MATKKASKKSSAKARSRGAVAPPPPTVSINEAARTIQTAVERALRDRRLQPKIRGPIWVGIWYNPVTKKFEVVNQFEQ